MGASQSSISTSSRAPPLLPFDGYGGPSSGHLSAPLSFTASSIPPLRSSKLQPSRLVDMMVPKDHIVVRREPYSRSRRSVSTYTRRLRPSISSKSPRPLTKVKRFDSSAIISTNRVKSIASTRTNSRHPSYRRRKSSISNKS